MPKATATRCGGMAPKRSCDMLLLSEDDLLSCTDRAGLTTVPVVPWEPPPPPAARCPQSTVKFLPRCFDVWTTKKVLNVLGEKVYTSRENSGYAYEKRAPALSWYGPHPRMVNPVLRCAQSEADRRTNAIDIRCHFAKLWGSAESSLNHIVVIITTLWRLSLKWAAWWRFGMGG